MVNFVSNIRFHLTLKRYFLFIIAILSLSLLANTFCFAGEMTGLEVMEKQKKFHEVTTEYGEETMLLVDIKSNSKEKRQVKRYAKKMENGFNRYLLIFTAPADIKGTSILTHERENEDDQWIYMPATKKMQRIAKVSKKTYFMGTDFTYEDIEPEKIGNFIYKILKKEKVTHVEPDKNCYVIEAAPKNKDKKRASAYSRRILWVDLESFMTLKIEFYDRRNRLIKTQTSFEIERLTGTIYRPKKTIMNNHKKNHKTLTLVNKREINKAMPDKTFTERFILSGE